MTKQKFRLEDVEEGETLDGARVSDSSDLFNRSSNSCGPYCSCNTECKCYDKCDHCRCVDHKEMCSCEDNCSGYHDCNCDWHLMY